MATQLGQLDQRVSLQRVERVSDGGGGFEETWVQIARLWARVVPASGEERLAAQQREAEIGYHVTIRYRELPEATLSVVWRGKRLAVLWPADAGPRSGFLTLDCSTQEGL